MGKRASPNYTEEFLPVLIMTTVSHLGSRISARKNASFLPLLSVLLRLLLRSSSLGTVRSSASVARTPTTTWWTRELLELQPTNGKDGCHG